MWLGVESLQVSRVLFIQMDKPGLLISVWGS